MQTFYKRLKFIEEDLLDFAPKVQDYQIRIAMVELYGAVLNMQHIMELTKEFKA